MTEETANELRGTQKKGKVYKGVDTLDAIIFSVNSLG